MAVRHDVENLIRRGNMFHWRARIPRRFEASHRRDRFSFSLHVSDHKVAQLVARHLNLRLAELKNAPKVVVMSQAALHAFFLAERDKELEKQSKVALASRRYGNGDFARDVDLDLQHAWAYRLLEHFGQGADFSFEQDCRARRWLVSQGVPDEHIVQIGRNFRALKGVSDRRILEQHLTSAMEEFGIANTSLNREKAMIAYFRAHAEALMSVEDRYPLSEAKLSSSTQTISAATASTQETVDVNPPPQEPLAVFPSRTPEPTPLVSAADKSTDRPSTTAAAPMAAEGRVQLPLTEFLETGEQLVRKKAEDWTPESANDFRALLRMFVGVLEEHGVRHSGEITQYHIGKLADHFAAVPTHWGKSSTLRNLSTVELRAVGRKMLKDAEEAANASPDSGARKIEAKVGLSPNTVRKHFANLQNFLAHLKGYGYDILDWSFDGVRPRKPKPGSIRLKQFKPKPNDIEPLFQSPLFVGCKGAKERDTPGDHVYHGALFYLPIMITYIGARRAELAGLRVDDIYQDEEGGGDWIIHIRHNDLRRLKNIQSDRKIPLHPELVRLGLLEYRDKIKHLGYQALFPELFSTKTDNDPGDRFYTEFVPLMKKTMGDAIWDRTIHAFRHGLSDYLKQNGVPSEWIDDLCGRLSEGETNTRYTNPAGLSLLRTVMAKFPIITGNIPARPITVLPWVEEGNPSPWAREAKK